MLGAVASVVLAIQNNCKSNTLEEANGRVKNLIKASVLCVIVCVYVRLYYIRTFDNDK